MPAVSAGNRTGSSCLGVIEPMAFGGNNCSGPIDVATTCLADGWHGDFESETFIVAPWDEAQITSPANRSRVENGSPSPTLNGSGQVSIIAAEMASAITASAGSPRGHGWNNLIAEAYAPDVAATLSSGSHASHAPGRRREDDTNLVALAFNWQAGGSENDTSFRGKSRQYICRAGDYCGALGVTRQDAVALAFQDSQSETRVGACLGTLDSNYGSRRRMGVFERYGLKWIVRRLTPKEGERLQGWPDDFTRWRHDGQQISDSARWKLIGNGVATPVAYWLASRLRTALEAS